MKCEKKYYATVISIVVIIVLFVVGACFFSQRKISFANGILHEYTWRYNSSMKQEGDCVFFSTYDKITKETTIQTYSQSTDELIRSVVVEGDLEDVTILDKNGDVLKRMPIFDNVKE